MQLSQEKKGREIYCHSSPSNFVFFQRFSLAETSEKPKGRWLWEIAVLCNAEQAGKGWDQIGKWPKHWIDAVFCSMKQLLKNKCVKIKRVHGFICECIVFLLQMKYYLEIPEDCIMSLMIGVNDAKPLVIHSFYWM